MKSNTCKACFILLMLSMFFPGKAFSGAWTMEKGGMYNRIAFNYYESNREYNSSGNSRRMPNNGRFYDRNI